MKFIDGIKYRKKYNEIINRYFSKCIVKDFSEPHLSVNTFSYILPGYQLQDEFKECAKEVLTLRREFDYNLDWVVNFFRNPIINWKKIYNTKSVRKRYKICLRLFKDKIECEIQNILFKEEIDEEEKKSKIINRSRKIENASKINTK